MDLQTHDFEGTAFVESENFTGYIPLQIHLVLAPEFSDEPVEMAKRALIEAILHRKAKELIAQHEAKVSASGIPELN